MTRPAPPPTTGHPAPDTRTAARSPEGRDEPAGSVHTRPLSIHPTDPLAEAPR